MTEFQGFLFKILFSLTKIRKVRGTGPGWAYMMMIIINNNPGQRPNKSGQNPNGDGGHG